MNELPIAKTIDGQRLMLNFTQSLMFKVSDCAICCCCCVKCYVFLSHAAHPATPPVHGQQHTHSLQCYPQWRYLYLCTAVAPNLTRTHLWPTGNLSYVRVGTASAYVPPPLVIIAGWRTRSDRFITVSRHSQISTLPRTLCMPFAPIIIVGSRYSPFQWPDHNSTDTRSLCYHSMDAIYSV